MNSEQSRETAPEGGSVPAEVQAIAEQFGIQNEEAGTVDVVASFALADKVLTRQLLDIYKMCILLYRSIFVSRSNS